ncbi:hypothetical protein DL765_007645 [Monosporascus sp. GIB2]|nr:hypothetical protein DL765_007645 [Monosporascus sp. GIB2]
MQVSRALRGSFKPPQERTAVSSTYNVHPRRSHIVRDGVRYNPSPWPGSPMRWALPPIPSIIPFNDGSATDLVDAGSTELPDSIGLGIIVNPQPNRRGPEAISAARAGGGDVSASRPAEHRGRSNQASSGGELSVVELDGEGGDIANAGTHPKQILTAPPPSPRPPTLDFSSTAYPATHDPVDDGWHDFLEWRNFVNSVQQAQDARYDEAESSYGYDSGFRQEARSSQFFNSGDDDDHSGENQDDLITSCSGPLRDTLPRRPRTGHRHRLRAYSPQRAVGQRSASDPACLIHGGSPLRQVTHARDLVSVGSGAAWASGRCEVGLRGADGGDGADGGGEPWRRSVTAGAEEADVGDVGAAIMTARKVRFRAIQRIRLRVLG